ncbi:ABC transporter ATP-binding protein/permease [Flavobacteriales bacterium]|nr:ABC transporter ATP-binding protein/permease [Flavobacteriales bacterium]
MFFARVIKNLKLFKKEFGLNVLFSALYALFSAIAFFSLMPMLEVLFNGTNQTLVKPTLDSSLNLGSFLENWLNYQVVVFSGDDNQKAILFVVFVVIFLFFLKNVFNYFALFFSTIIRNGVIKIIRKQIFESLIVLPMSFFSNNKKGDVISRITSDVIEVQNSYLSIIEIFIRDPLSIIFTITAMFIISLELTLFVIVFIPISGFIISYIGKTLRRRSLIVQKEQGELTSITEETLNGISVIKAFVSETFFTNKFLDSNSKFFKYSNSLVNRQNIAAPLSEFLGILVIGVLLWYGGKLVLIDMDLKPAAFITYMGLSYGVLTPAKSISKALYALKKGNAAAERVYELIDSENEFESQKINDIKSFKQNIEMKNVSFSYGETEVLKNISLKIKKGETLAIVGASGSGKSTLANLLPRFYNYNSGELLIDGNELRNISKKSIRSLIGIVGQESILFNGSIRDNILLGKKIDDDEVYNALKTANALDFINEFDDKIDHKIADNGVNLSGGQKQRIAIARAIISKSPILILDEATSSLDSKSEKLVQDALIKLMDNKTSIVIAHRLSTVKNAQNIIVLEKGKIVEQGTHDDLISRKGIYNNLITLQSLS